MVQGTRSQKIVRILNEGDRGNKKKPTYIAAGFIDKEK